MTNVTTETNEDEAIAKTIEHYVDGARLGRDDDMKLAFHEGATIFGLPNFGRTAVS